MRGVCRFTSDAKDRPSGIISISFNITHSVTMVTKHYSGDNLCSYQYLLNGVLHTEEGMGLSAGVVLLTVA